MAITTEMKVTGIGQYRSAIAQAQASVKTLDQELKRNEAQFKATGDKEQYMADKARILQMRMQTQATAAKQAEAAIKAMREQGVNPTSQAFQRFQQQLSAAQTGMLETQVELQNLTKGENEAAQGADKLTTSVNGISKKVSLDAVISGIDKITSGMERAAKKAVELGRALWEEISNSGSQADNIATTAAQLGMGIEDYQRYQKVFDQAADITVADWLKAKQRVQRAINDPSQETTDILNLLGVRTHSLVGGKGEVVEGAARNYEEVFWEIGERLRQKVASGEMTQDLADTYANTLFGKGFANLNPIFALGQEGFAAELEKQNVVSEDAINKLAEMNDAIVKLQGDFKSLETEAISGLAPGLTAAAEALDGLLGKLLEYLQSPDGQQMLERLGTAVSGLFEDLGTIDPENLVGGFVKAFEDLTGAIQWIVDNKDTVVGALETIVAGWAALKLTGGALQVLQLINGLKGFAPGGAAGVSAFGVSSATGTLFNTAAIEGMGGSIATKIAGALTSTPLTVAIAAVSLVALAEAIKTAVNNEDPITEVGMAAGMDRERAREINDQMKKFVEENPDNPMVQKAKQSSSRFIVETLFSGALFTPASQKQAAEKISDDIGDVPVKVSPVAPEDAASSLAAQFGTIHVPVSFVGGGGGGGAGRFGSIAFHANGLPFVPFDGYIAALHRGERVVPAREEAARNFSSNLYVESMYMNNGMDANGLAASIAAENQRIMRGHGS